MAGFFSNGSCQCQTSLFYLVSDIYELDTNGLGKCLGQGLDHVAVVCGGREPHVSVQSEKLLGVGGCGLKTVTCVLIFSLTVNYLRASVFI